MTDLRALLARTAGHVAAYREAAAEAAVFPEVDLDAVRVAIGGRLPDAPLPAGEVRADAYARRWAVSSCARLRTT